MMVAMMTMLMMKKTNLIARLRRLRVAAAMAGDE
jgi:hypothetical protein